LRNWTNRLKSSSLLSLMNCKSIPEKPWAILGINRKQYAAAKPRKKAGMTKEKYAEMLNLMPHE